MKKNIYDNEYSLDGFAVVKLRSREKNFVVLTFDGFSPPPAAQKLKSFVFPMFLMLSNAGMLWPNLFYTAMISKPEEFIS